MLTPEQIAHDRRRALFALAYQGVTATATESSVRDTAHLNALDDLVAVTEQLHAAEKLLEQYGYHLARLEAEGGYVPLDIRHHRYFLAGSEEYRRVCEACKIFDALDEV